MKHRYFRLHAFAFRWRAVFSEEVLAFLLAVLFVVSPAAAIVRFQDRGLFMQSSEPGVTTSYTISFQFTSPQAVGSLDMLACVDPIPYDPCVPPAGLDLSNASLSNQSGDTGFSILSQTTNHIILTRAPAPPTSGVKSSYTFDNVVNPTNTNQSFAIRLKSLGTTNGSGDQIDVGSVEGQVTEAVTIETQVPPMLIFCVARTVGDDCSQTSDVYYTNMGQLSPDDTLTAFSQMAVGTNASQGFVITANGAPPAAGTNVIDSTPVPTESTQGTNQFGINLVANNSPSVGDNPVGDWANAVPSANYSEPNKYLFNSGDIVATSSSVSLMKKFTVSYILNSSPDLHPGVYTTTITYVASGRF